jgi:lipid II:glycine glycyltransferase (peptidoglycan interpeptide bridge formation enzyme)
MKKKGRYNIRVARRHEVSVVEDNSTQGLADFMRLYKETMRRQDIRRHSTDYFHNLAETLFPYGRGSILFAEYQAERLATAMIIYGGDTATYKYGGSLRCNRTVMAPYLLHFEAMLKAKSRGCKWYDWYGVSPPDQTVGQWQNFSAFKRKFGGRELSFVPALDLVYDSEAYQAFRNRRKS